MVDMTPTIIAKSDQTTADDLLSGPRTITVTRVTANEGNADQPVNVFFEGDDGKPFRPCKSMRRVMVKVWGPDSAKYAGRSLTIYNDPKVKWGGMEVGGVRISHMTDMTGPLTVALQVTRGKKASTKIQPLKVEKAVQGDDVQREADKIIANIRRAPDIEKLNSWFAGKPTESLEAWKADRSDVVATVRAALDAKRSELQGQPQDEDPFEGGDA